MRHVRHISVLGALLLFGCYDSSFSERGPEDGDISANYTIGRLNAEFTLDEAVIRNDIIIRGRVTTDDRAENFYRSFCIADAEAGMEIMVGLQHLHNDYPQGTEIAVRMQGMKLCRRNGVMQLGREPAPGSKFRVDYLAASTATTDRIITRTSTVPEPVLPQTLKISELTLSLCGMPVRIDRLRFIPPAVAEGETTDNCWAGVKRFEDADGNAICTYVRPYARFATHEIPTAECSLTGILQYDDRDSCYLLKLSNENDCTIQTSDLLCPSVIALRGM